MRRFLLQSRLSRPVGAAYTATGTNFCWPSSVGPENPCKGRPKSFSRASSAHHVQ